MNVKVAIIAFFVVPGFEFNNTVDLVCSGIFFPDRVEVMTRFTFNFRMFAGYLVIGAFRMIIFLDFPAFKVVTDNAVLRRGLLMYINMAIETFIGREVEICVFLFMTVFTWDIMLVLQSITGHIVIEIFFIDPDNIVFFSFMVCMAFIAFSSNIGVKTLFCIYSLY